MIFDSILGGSVQLMYRCPKCKKITEATFHLSCGGTYTNYEKGLKFINNDVVNVLAGFSSSLIIIFAFFLYP